MCGVAVWISAVHDGARMKLYLTYGFLISLGGAILTMAMFALGFHTDNIAAGQKWNWLGIAIALAGIALGMREYRREVGQGVMSYGRGVATGLFISLWSALFSAVFSVIYFTVVNPGFSEAMVQFQMAEMERKGIPPASIDQAEGMIRAFSSAPAITIMGAVMGVIMGLVLSLILAAILKSKGQDAEAPPVAS